MAQSCGQVTTVRGNIMNIRVVTKAGLVCAASVVCAVSANAATTVYTPGGGNLSAGETDYANFDTSFGNASNVTGTSGAFSTGVFASSVGGVAAEPASGDQGDAFYAVLGGGTTTFSFLNPVGILGFDLGSADSYNSVTLNFASGGSQVFAGAQLNVPFGANGNQTIPATNGRVTIYSFDDAIVSATFASSQNSFEFDNIGIAAVPEPSTWAMLILGFGVIGSVLRGRSTTAGARRSALA